MIMKKMVNGVEVGMTAQEEASYLAQMAQDEQAEHNDAIDAQIRDLESQQATAIREYVLGIDTATLPSIQAQISALKAQKV